MIETLEIEPAARALLDHEAVRSAEAVVQWAEGHAGKFKVRFKGARVWHWRSYDDPSVQEAVIEIDVDGQQEEADSFWDALSDFLGKVTNASASPAAGRLSARIRRQ